MQKESYTPVPCPHDFAVAMEKHWSHALGNTSSNALFDVWHQMGNAFGRLLMGMDNRWMVLSPPTGSGKTQGTSLYCSMLAKENLTAEHQAGVLIVTRFKTESENIAITINEHVGQTVAMLIILHHL